MRISKLKTPAVLLRKEVLLQNIENYQRRAFEQGKALWPMTKTPKSSDILRLQGQAGAGGVLCGTLDECEQAVELGFNQVMYAYPFTDPVAIKRVVDLSHRVDFYVRLDSVEGARILQEALEETATQLNYLLIIDAGLHRFGVEPREAAKLVEDISAFKNLTFKGIATHPGHVYQASDPAQLGDYAEEELQALKKAKGVIESLGIPVEMVSTGSTPTYSWEVLSELVTHLHPGNYVFHDAVQMALGVVDVEQVSLVVLSSVISNPREGIYLIDAGAKCLGLDKGAHGNTNIQGHGIILGHEDALLQSVSEEVGVLRAPQGSFALGERVMIIPNHACTTANLTSFLYLEHHGELVGVFEVDIRGNSTLDSSLNR